MDYCKNGHDKDVVGRTSGRCRVCRRTAARRWDKNHPGLKNLKNKQWQLTHKERVNEKGREWAKNHPASVSNARWKRKGINFTFTEYQDLLQKQNNGCAICFRDQRELERQLAVDHCHLTGKVRGLLCTTCNLGLGYLNDDIKLLQRSIKYLYES